MQKQLMLTALMVFITIFSSQVKGQNSDDAREVTSKYFIQGAFVVEKPGTILSNTSILIEDGIITSVGKNIPIPYDAKIIKADSMFVYAAFIDAATHAGIPKKEDGDRPTVNDPGNPPMAVAGITPQHKAVDHIKFTDKSISDMREAGYGYLHVMPRGRMLPGTSSIITTGKGDRENMTIVDNKAMFAQLKSARGVFPNTIIGVMSKFRDVFKNASYKQGYKSVYDKNPKGLQRPDQAKEYNALKDVVTKSQSVYFKAEKTRDIFRVLKLQNELGFNLVLTDVRQANLVIPQIKSKNIPVVLSLKLPKKIEEKKEDKKKKKKDDEKKNEVISPEKISFKKRKQTSYDVYESQASSLAKSGIDISFSSLSVKPKDIKENLERIMAKGLTQDQILAGLTTNPAKLIGISDIAGTIEKGKLANIFISDTLYFNKAAKIKYALVDGKLFEYEAKKKKKGSGTSTEGIEGKWLYTLEIPGDETNGTMVIEKSGDEYSIQVDSSDEPGDYENAFDIDVNGDNVTYGLKVENSGMTLNITTDITFDGDDFEGTMSITQFGTFPIKGSRSAEPK